jgi:hypothetical protein
MLVNKVEDADKSGISEFIRGVLRAVESDYQARLG